MPMLTSTEAKTTSKSNNILANIILVRHALKKLISLLLTPRKAVEEAHLGLRLGDANCTSGASHDTERACSVVVCMRIIRRLAASTSDELSTCTRNSGDGHNEIESFNVGESEESLTTCSKR